MLSIASLAVVSCLGQMGSLQEHEPIPIVFVLVSVSGDAAVVRNTTLVNVVEERLVFEPDYRVDVDLDVAEQCRNEMRCVARQVLGRRARLWPSRDMGRYLVVASRLTEEGAPDALAINVLDGERAAKARDEEALFEQAVLLSFPPQLIEDEAALQQHLKTVAGQIDTLLTSRKHRRVFGELAVHPTRDAPDVEVYLDDSLLGRAAGGEAVIHHVNPGNRRLSLYQAGVRVFDTQVQIRPGASVQIDHQLEKPSPPYATSRSVLMWSGWATLLVGASLTGYGIYTRAATDGRTMLLPPQNVMGNPIYADLRVPNEPDAFLPVGIGLLTAGLSLGLGLSWFGDDHDAPWLQVAVASGLGAGLFALTFGLQ